MEDVSARPVELEPVLVAAIERARKSAKDSRERLRGHVPYTSPLSEDERAAVAKMLANGTYRQLADVVTRDDPDLDDR